MMCLEHEYKNAKMARLLLSGENDFENFEGMEQKSI
jgi:hypothetical protein